MDYPKSVANVGLVNGKFVDENAATGVVGSLIPSVWGNAVTDEILHVIAEAGLSPSEDDLNQLAQAVRRLVTLSTRQLAIVADIGTVNAYAAVNEPALSQLPPTGFIQRLRIANANTGPSTYAPDGLQARPIYGGALQTLQGGEIPPGVITLMYLVQSGVNGGSGGWVILDALGGNAQIPAATQSLHALQSGQAIGRMGALRITNTSSDSSALTLTATPAPAALTDQFVITTRIGATNSGNFTLSLNGFGAKPVLGQAGTPPQGGEVVQDGLATFIYSQAADSWLLLSCTGGNVDASQADAEAGTDNRKHMSPLRVKQAITKQVGLSTETNAGIVRLATMVEASAGSDASKAITPATLSASRPLAAQAKAWACIRFINGVPTIQKSMNVSSVTDVGVGRARINFAINMSDANYVVATQAPCGPNTLAAVHGVDASGNSSAPYDKTITGVQIFYGGIGSGTTYSDPYEMNAVVFN